MAQFASHIVVSIIYVNALREFFATHPLAETYRYSEDIDKRKLDIVRQWPEQPSESPMIVVDTTFTNEGERYLSDGADRLEVGGRHEGQTFSGVDNFDVRMTVYAHQKTDVEEIADLLLFALKRHIERSVWAASLMTVIPQRNVRTAGAGAKPYTDRELVWFVAKSQPVKTHWFDEVIYDDRILTYLATVEREGLEQAATEFQIQAGDG